MGLRFETEEHSKLAHYATLPVANFAALLSSTKVEGSLPEEGPGLVVANHNSWKDGFIVHWLAYRSGRTIRSFAKKTLTNPEAKETDKAVSRRTQQTIDNTPLEKLSLPKKIFKKYLIPAYMRGFNTIPVDIGGMNLSATKQAVNEIKERRLIGIFIQGTRRPRFDLLDTLDGAAFTLENLRRQGIDCPVIPVGISGSNGGLLDHIDINIGNSTYYSQILAELGGNNIYMTSQYLADRIAELVVEEEAKAAWLLARKRHFTKDDLQTLHHISPDIGTAYALIKNTLAHSPQEDIEELLYINRYAVFG